MKKIFIGLTILMLFFGCVYYNTFFNAKKFFDEAQSQPLVDGKANSTAKSKYTKAMKKCGIVIQDYKNSKYVDDALFMLAQCFYYKGSNYIQAIEKFQDLIDYYPESSFVAESQIYIAKAKFKQQRNEEAYGILSEFVHNPKNKKYHPQVLLIIATEYLEDDNLLQAKNYLLQIINNYPKSDEVTKAYLTLGNSFYKDEQYQESIDILTRFLKIRVKKEVKTEARYYIALDYLAMEDYDTAINIAKKVIKKQTNEHDIAKTNLIVARTFIGKEKYDDAEKIFKKIIANNRRTMISAEACYHLGGMLFQVEKDYEKAIEYFNKVKKENKDSEYVPKALLYSSIISQIIQYQGSKLNVSNRTIVDQQFKLAEYYIEELSLPDSALVIYNNVIENENIFQAKLDSLQISLSSEKDLFSQLTPDSLFIEDSLNIVLQNIQADTTIVDSVKNILNTAYDNIVKNTLDIKTIDQNFEEYKQIYIPFAYFTKIWVYKNLLQDMEKANDSFTTLSQKYPENRYYYAAVKLLNDEPVDFLTPLESIEITDYEEAISLMETDAQSSLQKFQSIIQNDNHAYFAKSLYSIGYINKFILADTTLAKHYFDRLIDEKPEANDILLKLSKYYDGVDFIIADKLLTLQKKEEKEIIEEEEETFEKDEKNTEKIDDLKQKEELEKEKKMKESQ
ncbi:MAG: tetratricopeptide repeat protein [Candidatus Cloacimonetes bacterium]|nr:tetratricopeptide repeat protein [Candidatus Cloacimonadota bacterium]